MPRMTESKTEKDLAFETILVKLFIESTIKSKFYLLSSIARTNIKKDNKSVSA